VQCRRQPSSRWRESERSTPRMERSRVASFPVAFRTHFPGRAGDIEASSDRLGIKGRVAGLNSSGV
jgi:hypothetical protein